ncbi:Zn(II)2Cys6 transcription factor [Aspergillus affinis]|uniref:Zn(II)2Cys6 transcription factor n=1 Tax=Aspergillus affinis TaxID=1070780 RepID=UPI0022FF089F|nr:uncharacterized protein KD926_007480 [Aspergillus affinis]KAI9040940.1 hypothetical protein KD926_007480 [Aspergillus affinis]
MAAGSCDEGRPSCENCKKHQVQCSFSATAGGAPSPPGIPGTLLNNDDAMSGTGQTSGITSELAISGLELLHHFSTSTAYTFSQHPVIQTFWRLNAPRIGFSAPYALRAILAISALHLAHLRPNQKQFYVNQAEYHHDAAVRQVTPNITHLMQDDSAGCFLFSILTSFIACAKPRKLDDLLLFRRGEISEWLVLFRGSGTIAKYASEALWSGPMAAILNIRSARSKVRKSLTADDKSSIPDVERLIRKEVHNEDNFLGCLGRNEMGVYTVDRPMSYTMGNGRRICVAAECVTRISGTPDGAATGGTGNFWFLLPPPASTGVDVVD